MKRLFLFLNIGLVFLAGCKASSTGSAGVKEFDTVISGFQYSPSSVTVNYGDTVRIYIKNNDQTTHGISLPSFGVQEFVQPGQTKTIQFVADKRGNSETFCSTDHGEKLLINVQG